jgi:hypothetical protein
LIVGLVLLSALALVAWGTESGIGLSPDSLSYLAAARRPGHATDFPPLYPMVLAALQTVGFSSTTAPLVLNLVLWGATVCLVGLVVRHSTRSSAMAAGAMGLTALAPPLLAVHVMAWSEPLFVSLGLLAAWSLTAYRETAASAALTTAALACGLAVATRWAGAAWVVTGLVVVLQRPCPTRGSNVARFLTLSCGPMAAWMLFNAWGGRNPTHRVWHWHPVTVSNVAAGLSTVQSWLLPPGTPSLLLWMALLALVVWGRRTKRQPWEVMTLFLGAYMAVLVAARSVFDAGIFFNDRMLCPLWPAMVVTAAAAVAPLIRRRPYRWVCLTLLLGVLEASVSLPRLQACHQNPAGYSGDVWRDSRVVELIRRLPAEAMVYTNDPNPFKAWTRRSVEWLPGRYDAEAGVMDADFATSVQQMEAQFTAHDGGWFVFLTPSMSVAPAEPSERELKNLLHWRLVLRQPEGAVYAVPPNP